MARASTALAVMARYPEPGKVKSRLAANVGVDMAADLCRAFILDLQERFAGGLHVLVWMYEPDDAPFESLVGGRCMPQRGADLGERMRHCFATLLGDGKDEFQRVVMIGADVPHIDAACIEEAERCLEAHDVVLGPSDDGGYYLVALRQPHDVFSTIEMGTPTVLEDTLRQVCNTGLRVHLLPAGFDIDVEADLQRLHRVLAEAHAPELPHTAALLARMYG